MGNGDAWKQWNGDGWRLCCTGVRSGHCSSSSSSAGCLLWLKESLVIPSQAGAGRCCPGAVTMQIAGRVSSLLHPQLCHETMLEFHNSDIGVHCIDICSFKRMRPQVFSQLKTFRTLIHRKASKSLHWQAILRIFYSQWCLISTWMYINVKFGEPSRLWACTRGCSEPSRPGNTRQPDPGSITAPAQSCHLVIVITVTYFCGRKLYIFVKRMVLIRY